MHTSNVFTSVWHQLLSFIATLSGGTSCKFIQLLEFQISVSCIDTGYKQEGLQRELKLTHRFCHLKYPCNSYVFKVYQLLCGKTEKFKRTVFLYCYFSLNIRCAFLQGRKFFCKIKWLVSESYISKSV